MALPKQVSAASYAAAWDELSDLTADLNGVEPFADELPPLSPGFVPRVTNAEAAAIIRAWQRAAARSRVRWLWTELLVIAYGWRRHGDRFDMSAAHMREPYPAEYLPALWAWTARLAQGLDDEGTVVRPLYLDGSRAGYEDGARAAWSAMKDDGWCRVPIPGRPPEEWPSCDVDKQPITDPVKDFPPRLTIPWWAWLGAGYLVYRALGGRAPLER